MMLILILYMNLNDIKCIEGCPVGPWKEGPGVAVHHQLGCWKWSRRRDLPSRTRRTEFECGRSTRPQAAGTHDLTDLGVSENR